TAAIASAPAPSSTPGPSATPPNNTAAPTISGAVQQGQTLVASAGSWSSTTTTTYTYQWQRCDSNGGSCAPVSGALAASYLLASADVGSTMRVAVTASNSAGSATATSSPTGPVGALGTSSSSSYYGEHFDGAFSTPIWASEPFAPAWTTGYLNQAARLPDCVAARPGVCTNGTVVSS